MQPVRRPLKLAAWLFTLVLVSLAAAGAGRVGQDEAAARQVAAEISSTHVGGGATLSGRVNPAPFIRSAARTQTGLRGKAPHDPTGKAQTEPGARPPVFALDHASGRAPKTTFPSSFVALRALGPRAPPLRSA